MNMFGAPGLVLNVGQQLQELRNIAQGLQVNAMGTNQRDWNKRRNEFGRCWRAFQDEAAEGDCKAGCVQRLQAIFVRHGHAPVGAEPLPLALVREVVSGAGAELQSVCRELGAPKLQDICAELQETDGHLVHLQRHNNHLAAGLGANALDEFRAVRGGQPALPLYSGPQLGPQQLGPGPQLGP